MSVVASGGGGVDGGARGARGFEGGAAPRPLICSACGKGCTREERFLRGANADFGPLGRQVCSSSPDRLKFCVRLLGERAVRLARSEGVQETRADPLVGWEALVTYVVRY